jgi:hypothetical protein
VKYKQINKKTNSILFKTINNSYALNISPYYVITPTTVSDFTDSVGAYKKAVYIGGKVFHTRLGQLYRGMVERSTNNSYVQRNNKAYASCTMAEEWQDFNNFAFWAMSQKGYNQLDCKGAYFELDSDLFRQGNKLYSPSTCCFIPQEINVFIASKKDVGALPTGVSKSANKNKYVAKIGIDGRQVHLGTYSTLQQAVNVYKARKARQAVILVEKYQNQLDGYVREALLNNKH